MTTTTTVAGRPLSGWTRDARHGTWHALLPGRSGESELGALRIDRALLAPEGTRERLAAAVLAVAKLRLPGVLGTVDLVAEAGEVWLITARPPAPTLTDLLARRGTGPDAGSAASVLNETAQSLLALHAAGLAHGALDADTVVLAPDGVALLAEAALGTVLGDAPDSARREADIAAWAGLSRTLGEAWAATGSPAAALFAHCSATAGAEGLSAARAALVAGRAALPAGFLRRTELRAAVAAATPEITTPPTANETGADAQRVRPQEGGCEAPRSEAAGCDVAGFEAADSEAAVSEGVAAVDMGSEGAGAVDMGSEGTGPGDVVLEVDRPRHTVPDEQLTMPSRTRSAPHQPRSAPHQPRSSPHQPRSSPHPSHPSASDDRATASDDRATVLGKRNRTPAGPPTATPTEATTPPPPGEDDDEIILRFGPGVPVEAQDVLRAQWRTAPVPPGTRPHRRRRRAWIATTAFLAAAAVLLWLLLRPSPAPTVTGVEVRAPAGRLHCGQTADLVGVVTTDGRGGPVTYHWLRSDGHDSGELVHMAHRGDRRVTVHLRWTVRGPGSFRGTARLQIAHQRKPSEAEGTFSYACS
ncbi:hypothetical protein OHB05_39500 [Streptomyces sp. NBC_00638]|uniref:hypothetical protein n=1 Tax=unclassified Streptomyces TaxID=2593676 RepID=UPI00225B5915|nr:hypothetical protein [Streptomyces sp. NBC_00638]MCX5008630.1 hypothetical protein [Streptomyces sp. NBC_00638]